MNRLFYLIIVVLLAISCESDNCPAPDQEANEIECTFTVGIPEIKTRAAAPDPSGSGQYANKLSYSFYTHDGEKVLCGTEKGQIVDGVQQFTISRQLVEGRQYFLYLVARNEDAPYKQYLTHGAQYGGSAKFEVQNSDPNFCFANQDSYDIFCNVAQITAGVDPGVILLHRPTAQLNIATRDLDAAASAGVSVVTSWIKCKMVTTYDFVGQHIVKDNFTFKYAPIPTHTVTLNDGTGDKEYRVISMNYILMGDAEKQTQDIVFSYSENADGSNPVELTFTSVPIQRNHRTYIVGDLLTFDGTYTLTVQPMMDPASDKTVTVSAR